jgi:hypothetical protein
LRQLQLIQVATLSFRSPDSTIKDFLKGTVPLNQRENSWEI